MRTKSLVLAALVLLLALGSVVMAQDNTVTIRLAGWASSPSEDAALQVMLDAFMAANPTIRVEFTPTPEYPTTMQTAFAAGDYANVFYVNSDIFPTWVQAGVIADGTDKIADQDDIYPGLRDVFTVDGKFYCPPKDFSILALQYNKDLFDAAGVAYPTADWTWDDLRAAAEALTTTDADGNKILGLVLPADLNRWLPFFYQAGGALFDADGNFTFDSDAARTAIDYYVTMVNDGIAGPASAVDSGWGGEALGKARAAMVMEGNWVIQFLLDNYPDLNWSVTPLARYASMDAAADDAMAGRATMAYTVCYAVGADNDYPDESWALVNFLTGMDGAQMVATSGFGVLPARISAAQAWLDTWTTKLTDLDRGDLATALTAFTDSGAYARAWTLPPGFTAFNDAFNAAVQQAFSGDLLPEDVIIEAAAAGVEILNR